VNRKDWKEVDFPIFHILQIYILHLVHMYVPEYFRIFVFSFMAQRANSAEERQQLVWYLYTGDLWAGFDIRTDNPCLMN
jgi:hypothetical protein